MNAVGDPTRPTMQELLHAGKLVAGSDAAFTCVPDDFFIAQEVAQCTGLPMWIAGERPHFPFDAAVAHGLRSRPLADTLLEAWRASRKVAEN